MNFTRTDADNEFLTFDRIIKIRSIVEKYGENKCYISFSGGKDSTVLSHLVDEAIPGNNIERVYADTGLDYNIMRQHIEKLRKQDPRIKVIKPSVNVKAALERDGYPFKSKEHSMYVDIYQRNGMCKTVDRYLNPEESRKTFGCPDSLKYQFTPEFKLKCSKKCCYNMKEKPMLDYSKEHDKPIAFVGLLGDEKGGRSNAKCMVDMSFGKHFQPLTACDSEWEEWYIKSRNIELCPLYYAPYNQVRSGCKGCPYNVKLQETLDMLGMYFPNERRQVELIWGPVYEEYRRLGYRLKRKGQIKGQISIFDAIPA
nr:phosphoadenosine phosphosulfate reductase family protein [uncultured Butyrivibrio sp.]